MPTILEVAAQMQSNQQFLELSAGGPGSGRRPGEGGFFDKDNYAKDIKKQVKVVEEKAQEV